jgi:hypothetical protein
VASRRIQTRHQAGERSSPDLGDSRAVDRLAAISLAGHPDPERFVAEFSGSERIVAVPARDRRRVVRLANTVSTHIRSIYAKLGVRDRSSAVQRARELQLLSADRAH